MSDFGKSTRSGVDVSTTESSTDAVNPRCSRTNFSGSVRSLGSSVTYNGLTSQRSGRMIKIQMTSLARSSFAMKGTGEDPSFKIQAPENRQAPSFSDWALVIEGSMELGAWILELQLLGCSGSIIPSQIQPLIEPGDLF